MSERPDPMKEVARWTEKAEHDFLAAQHSMELAEEGGIKGVRCFFRAVGRMNECNCMSRKSLWQHSSVQVTGTVSLDARMDRQVSMSAVISVVRMNSESRVRGNHI